VASGGIEEPEMGSRFARGVTETWAEFAATKKNASVDTKALLNVPNGTVTIGSNTSGNSPSA
jgi:hypothetical protein